MTFRLLRTALYYVTDFVAHGDLHIRVVYYVFVNSSSVCFTAMRYNFISQCTVNCTCFVQTLLLTQFYDMMKHGCHERKISIHFTPGGSRYRDSLPAERFGIRTPVGAEGFISPHLSSPTLRFNQSPVQRVPWFFPVDKVASQWCLPPAPVRPPIFCVFTTRYMKRFTFSPYLYTRRFSQIHAPAALVYQNKILFLYQRGDRLLKHATEGKIQRRIKVT